MKPRAEVQQRSDRAVHVDAAGIGPAHAADQPKQRRLARPVRPDDSDGLARSHREADVAKSPGSLDRPHPPQALRHRLLDGARPVRVVAAKGLADVRDDDHGIHHNSSAKRWLARRNHDDADERAATTETSVRDSTLAGRRPLSPDEHGAIGINHRRHRIESIEGLQTWRHAAGLVEDRRQVEEQLQRHSQHVLRVPKPDVDRGHGIGRARR